MPEKRRATYIALLLALVTLAVYWPANRFDFINYDDQDYIIYNPHVQHGFTGDTLTWAFTSSYDSNWHPITWLSHTLDFTLYGLDPGGHHRTNLLFHAANAALLFLVLFQLTGALWRGALVAALFAWHPLHVESVAWVSERKDVLSAFFWLLTLSAYGKYATSLPAQRRKAAVFYLLALLACALGLMSKPMVVTLPCVLCLLDFWPLKRIPGFGLGNPHPEIPTPGWRKFILEKIPFFALAALDAIVTIVAQRKGESIVTAVTLPLPDRIGNAVVSYVLYLSKTIWPVNLALPYPYSHEWTLWEAAGAGLILLAVTAAVVAGARRQPWLAVGWFWFLGTLVPVIGLVQVGIQFMADRYSYVPLIGIFIMAAWTIPAAWTSWPRPGLVFGAVIAGLLLFLLTGAETQLQYWRNSVTLFMHTTSVTRNNILAEYNLAEALARRGEVDEAIFYYQTTLALQPNRVEAHYNSQLQAHYNLGLIYRLRKQWTEAEAQFRACLRDDPKLARAHVNLGTALAAQGRATEALAEFHAAAQLDERRANDEAMMLAQLDIALAEAGRFAEALTAAQKSREAALTEGRKDLADAAEKRVEQYRVKTATAH